MTHTMISRRSLCAAIAALLLAAAPARAQVAYTWTGNGSDANWSTAGNWTATAGSPPPVSDLNNTFLFMTGTNQTTNTLDYNLSVNSVLFDSTSAFVVNGANTLTVGSGGIGVTSNSNQTINANLATGATGIWANDGSGTFTVNGGVNINAATLLVGGSGNSLYAGVISGGNGVQKVDAGTVTLAGTNTYTGTTNVTQGVLGISADSNLGTAPATPTTNSLILNGGTLSASASFTLDANRGIVVGTGSAGSAGTIDVASAQTLIYNGIIANNGTGDQVLRKTGAGTLILGGTSTYSGGTIITGGTVRADALGALGSAGSVALQPTGGTGAALLLNVDSTIGSLARPVVVGVANDTGTGTVVVGTPVGMSGSAVFGGPLQLRRSVTLQAGAADSTRFDGLISSSGTTPADITISAPTAATTTTNRVIFTQNTTANTYGNIIIGDAVGPHAVLQLGNGTASNNMIVPDSSNIFFATAPASGSGGSQLVIAPGSAATDGETVGALVSQTLGAGTITTVQPLAGAHTYTLTIGGGDQNGGYSGLIADSGTSNQLLAITKTGAGTQAFIGNNTYGGGTTINGGTLLVLGQTGTGSGTGTALVTVNTGGTFGGAGRAGGPVLVNSGGTIRGGDGSGGTLTLGNGLTLGSGANLGVQLFDSSTPSNTPGGSTIGTLPDPTSNNYINITSGILNANPANIHIVVDGGGNPFDPLLTYSYQIGQVNGQNLSGLLVSNQSQFTPIGFSEPHSFSLTGNSAGAVFLNVSPVPEPATVLGLAAGALGLGRLVRRRLRRA